MIVLFSWNVNGIRAVINKGEFRKFIKKYNPDILCLQETKAQQGQAVIDLPDYEEFWNSAEKKGYSGTAIFTKIKPIKMMNGFPETIMKKYQLVDHADRDSSTEGRVIAAEFEKFIVVTVYTPNSKDDLSRIPLRHKHWDPAFLEYCKGLETGKIRLSTQQGVGKEQSESYKKYEERAPQATTKLSAKSSSRVGGSASKQADTANHSGKPVLFCGDLNVAHTEDDLARPKPNVGKKGFTKEEREGFDNFVSSGFVDTFRIFTQGNGHYSWWTHWANARANNVGWRIDYWLASKSLVPKIKKAEIHAKQMGSDHCPVSVTLDI